LNLDRVPRAIDATSAAMRAELSTERLDHHASAALDTF